MKRILFLLILSVLATYPSLAQVSIRVIDAETNNPVENMEVIRKNNKGNIIEQKTTNSDGVVDFEDHSGLVVIPEKLNGYLHFPIELWKKDKGNELIYFLYPKSFLSNSPGYGKKAKAKDNEKSATRIPVEQADETIRVEFTPENENEIASIVEYPDKEASFPGGADAMKSFLAKEIIYPRHSLVLGDQGRIFVEFVVELDGSISNVKILRGVTTAIDLEAVRVIKRMPNWTPAETKGQPVRARCRIPLSFILS